MLLTFTNPDGTEATIRLKAMSHTSPPITLGRDKTASVVVDDPECSRVHTAIRYWDDIFVIRDMNSRNGTFVNGNKIDVARLNPGDVIKIGNTEIKATTEATPSDVTAVFRPHPDNKK